MLSFGFRFFCWYRGFCHRTGSDLLLFLFRYKMCVFSVNILVQRLVWTFIKIIRTPGDELLLKWSSGAPLNNLSENYVVLFCVLSPLLKCISSFVFCFICGRRRMTFTKHRIICIVLQSIHASKPNNFIKVRPELWQKSPYRRKRLFHLMTLTSVLVYLPWPASRLHSLNDILVKQSDICVIITRCKQP